MAKYVGPKQNLVVAVQFSFIVAYTLQYSEILVPQLLT